MDKIDRIIWYNHPEIDNGFNYQASPESYDYIRERDIDLVVVSNPSGSFIIDQTYLDAIKNADSPYARHIVNIHKQPGIEKRIADQHLRFWDDVIPLYLTVPMLFESEEKEGITHASLLQSIPGPFIYESVGNPSPPKPPIPARLESNLLSVKP